jgi:tRNA(Ile)-lysidine synthase
VPEDLARRIEAGLPPDLPDRIGVAVSGGSDSMALLVLLQRIATRRGFGLAAVTVDHRLRTEAAAEAAYVASFCTRLGVAHDTLAWEGWDGTGNVQNEARVARSRLISEWAAGRGVAAVTLGHTRDDQAETVVMRLARGSGVDGLSAMAPDHRRAGMRWLRPLLETGRKELRSFLRAEGVVWHEDPGNSDPGYDRVRVRQALAELEPLGVGAEALAHVAYNMREARATLDHYALEAARLHARVCAGAIRIDPAGFAAQPPETARRIVLAALRWITGAEYPPRGSALFAAMRALTEEKSATVAGCRLLRTRDAIWIFREFNAVRDLHAPSDALWDGRWRLTGGMAPATSRIAPLGEGGLAECLNWRDTGLPRALLLATPALWSGPRLLAAPLAGLAQGWQARLAQGAGSFPDAAFSH